MSSVPIRTLLNCYPLAPTSLFEKLKTITPVLHNYPQLAGNDYTGAKAPLPPAEVLAEADSLLVFNLPANLVSIEQAPRLKLIQVVGSGTFQVTNTPFFKSLPKDHPLILANSAGIHAVCIGEHVLMTTMNLLHRSQQVAAFIRGEQRWPHPRELGGQFVQELRGLTVGIIGYGQIAREIARLATAFGANIIVLTRSGVKASTGGYRIPKTGDPEGDIPDKWYSTGKPADVKTFLNQCDVVVDMLPAGEQTNGFIGREQFEWMKDSAVFVNAGRGETIDQNALVEALQNSLKATDEPTGATGTLRILGASLDVTNPEPLPDNHILFSLENAIITPHCSWASKTNFVRAVELFETNINRINEGKGALNALRGKGERD